MTTLLQIAADSTLFQTIFGSTATIAAAVPTELAATALLTQTTVYNLFVVWLLVGYSIMLLAHGGETGNMLKLIMNHNISLRVSETNNRSYSSALRFGSFLAVVALAVGVVKALSLAAVEPVGVSLQWVVPLATASLLVFYGAGMLLVDLFCRLTERYDLAQGLGTILATILSLLAVVATPFILLCSLNTSGLSIAFYVCFVALVAVGVIAFSVKTFLFFTEQKISILFWFLYLCAVVALPTGTLMTIIYRVLLAR